MSQRPQDADQSHKDRLDDAHFRFLEARRDNNATREALCKAGRAVETARRERDALYTQWNQLHASAKRGRLSATSPKELDEALEHRKRSERQAQQKTQRGEHNVSNENERTYEDYVHSTPFTTPTDSDTPLRNPSAEPRYSTPLSRNRTSQTPMSAHRYTPEWLETAQRLFRDYTSIKEFPEPPAGQCGKIVCAATAPFRALKACPCMIRKSLEDRSMKQLKKTRLGFHPDKFGRCANNVREDFERKATEMFGVMHAMYCEKEREMGN